MRRRVARDLLSAGAALALTAAILPTLPAGAVQGDLPGSIGSSATDAKESTYDVRSGGVPVAATDAQRDAVSTLTGRSGAGTRATWDSRFGTPRTIFAAKGYLTGARGGSAAEVARAWIDDNRAAFGMSAADVGALRITRNHALPGTGTRVVTFQQVFGGIAAVGDGRLNVAVTKDGKVLSYAGNPTRGSALLGDFTLSAADALKAVAAELAAGVSFTPEAIGEKGGFTEFAKGPFAASSYVQKSAFPVADGARAVYRVIFVEQLDEAYETFVDAATGEILFRESLVKHGAEGTVYENFPGSPKGGTPVVKPFGPTAESPSGYVDPTGLAGLAGPTTFGNNANTYANYSNFLVPGDQAPRPVSVTAQFNYPYEMHWQKTNGATVPPSYVNDLNPAATNLFWHHNRVHDEFYKLGFTESAGNFQLHNRDVDGDGTEDGAGGDPLLGLVHAGATTGGAPTYTGRDNAYMLTLPDGLPSWSGMFLWEPINDAFEGPYTDGNFDASVIEHEYGHGLSTRYVAGGSALSAHQSRSMGEGWSDWYALNYLYREGLQDKAVVGEYATGNATRGIRNWDYDQNPTVFGDIGYDLTGPQVHADGEIWTTMLWNLRKALVSKYGATEGGEVAARLVTDAMPLTAPRPSMLDARDGILLADRNRYQDANRDLIWTVFAKRGAGASALSATGNDTDPTPAYDHENSARNATLVGTVVNATTGEPVAGAKVFLGVFEARTTPVARSSSSGGFGVRAVAGTYPVTIQAPGFGSQTFENVSITAGTTTSLAFSVAPNLASLASGATVVSTSNEDEGLPGKFMLDDTEATVWSTKRGATAYNDGADKGRITVKLPQAKNVSSIQVSAFKNTTASRFAALKDFTFEVSSDGETWKTVRTGGFTYQTPRPVAPDLHYKTFALDKPVKASYVRLTIDSIQGETVRYAQAAELQVFGKSKSITPVPPPADPTFTDTGTIVAGNPTSSDNFGFAVTYGVTASEMTKTCVMPPTSQGADGWVTKLPPGFGDGTHSVSVVGGDTALGHDIDLYFLDSACKLVGLKATAAADEASVIPGGTVYVVSHLWFGADVPITLTAVDAG